MQIPKRHGSNGKYCCVYDGMVNGKSNMTFLYKLIQVYMGSGIIRHMMSKDIKLAEMLNVDLCPLPVRISDEYKLFPTIIQLVYLGPKQNSNSLQQSTPVGEIQFPRFLPIPSLLYDACRWQTMAYSRTALNCFIACCRQCLCSLVGDAQ